jgi:predicted transglutaminase-like cysteine proteinase
LNAVMSIQYTGNAANTMNTASSAQNPISFRTLFRRCAAECRVRRGAVGTCAIVVAIR